MNNRKRSTIQKQVLSIFLFSFAVLFMVNLYIYHNMNTIIENIDQTYVGNKNLMEIRSKLDEVQSCASEYLNTRRDESLKQFYSKEKEYKGLLNTLNSEIVNSKNLIMEKNIRNMSETYLETVHKALYAKQDKDIQEYWLYSGQADELFDYLVTCINNLNDSMFRSNSNTYNEILASVRVTEGMYNVILVLTAFLNICLIILFTKRMTKPLRELVETSREVGKGNLEVQLPEGDVQTEIGIVNIAFNQMVKSLKEYIEKSRKSVEAESELRENSIRMEAYLKDAQLKYLQAQINPHFLFNTLNAGAQLAMLEDADQTYRYIIKVADFFRVLVKKNDWVSTLQDEIELVDDYIYIINVRYAGEIQYHKQVDETLLNVCVPGMILQPIVENSVKHGFCDMSGEKHIDLLIEKVEDDIAISVRDNGIGMEQEQIDRILRSREPEKSNTEEGGIGLDNVITRLHIFYNYADEFEIISEGEHMGTEVRLLIPIEKKEQQHV